MNRRNLDQALAALADALYSQDISQNPIDIIEKLPNQSISGDKIRGGKITDFTSHGITDRATTEQIVVKDNGVSIKNVSGNLTVVGGIVAKEITVDTITVKEIKTEVKLEKDNSIIFSGDKIHNKGLIWSAKDYNKQFVFNTGPDRFYSSEIIDLDRNKHFSVGGVKVIDSEEIGPTVWKSGLREVGVLRSLAVEGEFKLNNYLFFNPTIDRLGIGIEMPHAALSVAEMGVEVMVGTDDNLNGMIGTFSPVEFNIVTDNTARITIGASGNITVGQAGKVVSVPGKLGIGVKNIDQNVDLHVAGPVKLNNHIQMYANAAPTEGTFTAGDIVFNSEPGVGKFVGWVCVSAGSPGSWYPFGEIKDKR